jgi:adenine-specific DNA-methyltransferase
MPKKPASEKQIESFVHDDASRRNIPPAEYQTMVRNQEKTPLQVAYERRNPDLDPQLIWRGKDLLDESPLVVNAPPLYIQEKIHPKVLIDDLKRRSKQGEADDTEQIDLFSSFNGLPSEEAKTEFYQHDQNWTNRMILGDSLQVMASLAEREGLRGKVQCIYFDPPYGIKFNSNFQWSTGSTSISDGSLSNITREPEQVKAFRDTWKDGYHSYLGYLRDRLLAARDLLSESGSIFVQIGDSNVHRVRVLLDEIFGDSNCQAQIAFKSTSPLGQNGLPKVYDYILWYAKDINKMKYRQLFNQRDISTDKEWRFLSDYSTEQGYRKITEEEFQNLGDYSRIFRRYKLTSAGYTPTCTFGFSLMGSEIPKSKYSWKTNREGMERLAKADRLYLLSGTPYFKTFFNESSTTKFDNVWTDQPAAEQRVYVVQTAEKFIERCLLMSTDPGDLVLDPTCGSGTTALVSEKWGRRWISIDTSRVAMALARARLMGARFQYYLLADSPEGSSRLLEINPLAPRASNFSGKIRSGFLYQSSPKVTLRLVANNSEIDSIWDKWQPRLEPLREQLNQELGVNWQEWDIPRDPKDYWSLNARTLHTHWWNFRISLQLEIDASISAKADLEYLYDRPYEDKSKVRVAGPFTVESLSPHRTMIVNDDDSLVDPHKQGATSESATDFAQMILDTLRVAGVQQAHKEDRIKFESLEGWPGSYIAGKGSYREADGTLKTAGIFIGPEFGTVSRVDLVEAARECADAGFDVLISCAFNYEAQSTEFDKLGPLPVLKARMNADLHMQPDLKNTGKGNLFVIFGEPDIDILDAPDNQILVKINGVDVFDPSTGEVRSDEPATIACWFIDSDYNGESFFVRQAYFLGQNDPYKSLKTSLKAEIDADAWETLNSDISVPFSKPSTGRIAIKVINHLGDEVMKVYRVG